ncbi:hypothetical protein ACFLWG_04175 [Chloroflexota bacterium]
MKKKTIIGFFILAVVLAVFLLGVTKFGPNTAEIEELESVEIREYEGEKLSSINDFRESSIKGAQAIDLESYHLDITGLVQNPGSSTYDEIINNQKSYKKVVRLNCV